jgi:hypothetical protein
MRYCLNPFAVATHNQVRAPRFVFHASHIAIGAAVWLVGHWFGWPPLVTVLLAAALAIYSKFVWFDWHRSSGRLFHPWVSYALNPEDFAADLGLTLLGAVMPRPIVFVGCYLVLSIFADPYV